MEAFLIFNFSVAVILFTISRVYNHVNKCDVNKEILNTADEIVKGNNEDFYNKIDNISNDKSLSATIYKNLIVFTISLVPIFNIFMLIIYAYMIANEIVSRRKK